MYTPKRPDALVLCGGAGLRLRSVTGDGPKSMANLAGRPFLELLLRQLHRHGFEHVILAVGYGADAIRQHFGTRAFGVTIGYSSEITPLGTGGAIRQAHALLASDAALVMNGDSYTDVDLNQVIDHHFDSSADATMVVTRADERNDVGSVAIDDAGRVVEFGEKKASGRYPFSNAGIYMMSGGLIASIPVGTPVSLEHELFPKWIVEKRKIQSFLHSGGCVDIGTPQRFEVAQTMLGNVEAGKAK